MALTKRRLEILRLIAQGYPNKVIAADLGISEQTVKNHVSSILSILGAGNRAHAVLLVFGVSKFIVPLKAKRKGEI